MKPEKELLLTNRVPRPAQTTTILMPRAYLWAFDVLVIGTVFILFS